MQIQFLLGPAGSGKTHRCLAEIREELSRSPQGAPLVLLAPKQATFQLERQLLADGSLQGYTRLHILSFERLARFILRELNLPLPKMLDEEGRLMVLRALLARRRDDLKLFRASSRLTGFAAQLSLSLHEFQRHLLTPDALLELADKSREMPGLSAKLNDLATLLRDYSGWLDQHQLRDTNSLLAAATAALKKSAEPGFSDQVLTPQGTASSSPRKKSESQGQGELFDFESDLIKTQVPGWTARGSDRGSRGSLDFGGLWLDGFAEFSPQELDLLAAIVSHCQRATIAFCLDRAPKQKIPWLSTWSAIGRAFEECQNRLNEIPGAQIAVEELPRDLNKSRFTGNPILSRLEKLWPDPAAFASNTEHASDGQASSLNSQLRLATCANPEAEAELAAREILRFVRAGGRFRDASVIVRSLEDYHHGLQRVFSRFEIPFFLDRRESVSHHPLAEFTRSALRIAAFNWSHEDWFAALKSGLAHENEIEIDHLENEALARGWKRLAWLKPIETPDDPPTGARLEALRRKIVPPFLAFVESLANTRNKPNGTQLADALRQLWRSLDVEETLNEWSATPDEDQAPHTTHRTIHATVWDQMNAWLDNVSLAFATESISLRDWLPILEAGLANLAVGVIPPALDQVLVGSIDRSRNPDVKLAVVLGLNEGVFPAPPQSAPLLTDMDRDALEHRGVALGASPRQQIGRERFFGYIAMTRARQRLVLSCSAVDVDDRTLNPSPFLTRVHQLFPYIEMENVPCVSDWRDAEHANELIAPLLTWERRHLAGESPSDRDTTAGMPELPGALAGIAVLRSTLDQLRHFRLPSAEDSLSPTLAEKLYGAVLRTSVSRLEQFAACPFKFFVHSGLRAEERKLFELDAREQGSFQHDVLKEFHEQLQREGKRWRDATPSEARERIRVIAQSLAEKYHDGLLRESDETKFTARVLTASLQDFAETLVGWMHTQYAFDPAAVEVGFGDSVTAPWTLDIGAGHSLALRGRIDRVDFYRDPGSDEALCVVLDYKSSEKKLDALYVEHGLQLQLLAYLNVLRHWPEVEKAFSVKRLVPAGVFYVNLRGKFEGSNNRRDALAQVSEARKLAYRHSGRFDSRILSKLDSREAEKGDQFNYRKTKDGNLNKAGREPMATEDFIALLDSVEVNLKRMGGEIFSGKSTVSPFRKGAATACLQCDYHSICRIDPWTHPFRALGPPPSRRRDANENHAGETPALPGK